jgi:hypothetical protein
VGVGVSVGVGVKVAVGVGVGGVGVGVRVAVGVGVGVGKVFTQLEQFENGLPSIVVLKSKVPMYVLSIISQHAPSKLG